MAKRHWWDVPDAPVTEPWPRRGLKSREDWAEDADSHLHFGLRSGLLAALDAGTVQYRDPESEEELLSLAIYVLTDMVNEADEALSWLIAEAHYKGLSWTDVGKAMGISKQAAHKRFAQRVAANLDEIAAEREIALGEGTQSGAGYSPAGANELAEDIRRSGNKPP